ncbi:MAG: DUF502 domain-containing protein [Pseudomonadota bacterium]
MAKDKKSETRPKLTARIRRHLLTGLLTAIPLMVTWFVLAFLFRLLSQIGQPLAQGLARSFRRVNPDIADFLLEPWLVPALSVFMVIVLLYLLGVLASMVIGRRLIGAFDMLMQRIPLVQTIYGAVSQLLGALKQKPDGVQRVVLIDFPSPEMKAVGFVTKTLKDADTGDELAAVYVPTTPNPTSGYLEIVPVDRVISTTWTFDEAMTFIVSGGAVSQETMNYSKSAEPPEETDKTSTSDDKDAR